MVTPAHLAALTEEINSETESPGEHQTPATTVNVDVESAPNVEQGGQIVSTSTGFFVMDLEDEIDKNVIDNMDVETDKNV